MAVLFCLYFFCRLAETFKKSVSLPPNLFRGVAQLASALAWGARGRKFESSHPDESNGKTDVMEVTSVF